MNKLNRIACIVAVGTLCTASPLFAQEATPPGTTKSVEAPASDGAFGAVPPIAATELRRVTGRDDIGAMVASATQRNTVSNNSVVGTSTTGSVHIDGNAFQNLQGLAVINANSGNNVAINSAMNVVVNLAPR